MGWIKQLFEQAHVLPLALAVSVGVGGGCAHSIHEQHVGGFAPYPKGTGTYNVVEAQSEQFTVLYLAFNTNYVDQAYEELLNQCPRKIAGITTQTSTSLGFLSWTNKVRLRGLCLN